MSDCTSSWHIPVGCGNNYLSNPQSTTDRIMIMTFSAAVYSKICRISFISYNFLQSWEFITQECTCIMHVSVHRGVSESSYCMLKAQRQ